MWEVTFCTSPSSSLLNLIEWVIFIFHTLAWPQATNISLRFFMCMDNLTFYLHCRVQHRVADILLDKSVNTRILLANSESLKYSTLSCVELLHFYLFEFNLLLFCCLLSWNVSEALHFLITPLCEDTFCCTSSVSLQNFVACCEMRSLLKAFFKLQT